MAKFTFKMSENGTDYDEEVDIDEEEETETFHVPKVSPQKDSGDVIYDFRGKGGCYSLKWPIRGGFARKGTLFQVSGMQNDRDFMSFGIRNGCEICHLGILKRLT